MFLNKGPIGMIVIETPEKALGSVGDVTAVNKEAQSGKGIPLSPKSIASDRELGLF